jgi:hypothetical protein
VPLLESEDVPPVLETSQASTVCLRLRFHRGRWRQAPTESVKRAGTISPPEDATDTSQAVLQSNLTQ